MAEQKQTTPRYFVAKCEGIQRLYTARDTCIWACTDRQNRPQPKDVLTEAFTHGQVVLLFSVSNCHGWHGIATMETAPDSEATVTGDKLWYKFRITWDTLFAAEFGEQCLPHKETEGLKCLDGTEINKARNLQEADEEVGMTICSAVRDHYKKLCEKRAEKTAAKRVDAYFVPKEDHTEDQVWEKLIGQVEEMGEVLLACAFGSQRYNLHTSSSDVDMFIVYAAPTSQILGFSQPQHTIKNRDTECCDYTVHEVHRFCELLLAGDPRCVEALFLHPSSIVRQHESWTNLTDIRQRFLTRQCLDKYVRDATGAKGTRLLDKWVANGVALETPMVPKVAKLFYIILRLLQNARDVTEGELRVYRAEDSPERKLLLSTRQGEQKYQSLRENVDSLLSDIKERRDTVTFLDTEGDTQNFVQHWLVNLRYGSLKKEMDDLTTKEMQ